MGRRLSTRLSKGKRRCFLSKHPASGAHARLSTCCISNFHIHLSSALLPKPPTQTRPAVMHIGFALFTEMLEGGMNGSLYSGSLATALATHLLRKYALIRQKPVLASYRLGKTQLQRAVEYIHDHLADEIALETLAQQVNLSTSHFNAVFKQQFGLAPYQYILQQRVQRIHTDFSVAEVAADVGFYDQSHLTRHMRRLMGITPAALQRQRNVQNPH
jgi:AraC family transcriptional regulator